MPYIFQPPVLERSCFSSVLESEGAGIIKPENGNIEPEMKKMEQEVKKKMEQEMEK